MKKHFGKSFIKYVALLILLLIVLFIFIISIFNFNINKEINETSENQITSIKRLILVIWFSDVSLISLLMLKLNIEIIKMNNTINNKINNATYLIKLFPKCFFTNHSLPIYIP